MSPLSTGASGDMLQTFLAAVLPMLLVGGLLYVYISICIGVMAARTRTPGAWACWIPIANMVLLCAIGKRPGAYVLLLFIPIVNLIVGVMLWMAAAEACGRPSWTGALVFLPGIGLLVPAYLALGAGSRTGHEQIQMPAGPPLCPACSTSSEPGETFCGNCGGKLPDAAAMAPIPVAPRSTSSSGKLALGAVGMLVLLAVLVGGAGYALLRRQMGYTPPERKPPALPQRLAGTMHEFPVDTEKDNPARPTQVVSQTFGKSSKPQVQQAWLPSGVSRDSLPRVARSMTSAAYTTKRGSKADRSGVYVHVMDPVGSAASTGKELAKQIASSSSGKETRVTVDSPSGKTYEGERVQTSSTEVFVLNSAVESSSQGPPTVIIIYAADTPSKMTAERLAQNVGNGQGIIDDPEAGSSASTLPASLPSDLILEQMETQQVEEFGDVRVDSQKEQQAVDQIRRFLPERITTATYRDSGDKEWKTAVLEYGQPQNAWSFWMFLRWTAGVGMHAAPDILGETGLTTEIEEERILLVRKGPYILFASSPKSAAPERLAALAKSFQM